MRMSPRLLGALLVLAAAPAAAQGLALGQAGEHQPIDIQADNGIEWQQNAQVYIARGNAVAKRGTSEVHADTLVAHYRPAKPTAAAAAGRAKPEPGAAGKPGEGGATEIYRVDADGHVTLKGETQTITGEKAVYDVDQLVVVVTGKDLKLTTQTDVVTARDSFEWYDQKQIGVARGDAVAAREGRRIRADVLTAYVDKAAAPGAAKPAAAKPAAKAAATAKATAAAPAPGASVLGDTGQIRRVDAQGHVLVSTPTDIGRSDFGVYDAKKGIVTLIGNVTLTHGQDVVRGQYAVMDLNTNVSRIMPAPGGTKGPVEGVFVRQDSAAPRRGAGKP